MMFRTSLLLLAGLALPASLAAQCLLGTPAGGGAAEKGAMFDLVNISPITCTVVALFQRFSAPGTAQVEIWSRPGSWVGHENSAMGWILSGSGSVLHGGPASLTFMPIYMNVVIPPFTTRAFYVTATSATPSLIANTPGVGELGSALAGDINLELRGGIGKDHAFGTSHGLPTDGRLWNGRVVYLASHPAYETNDPRSSLTLDGELGTRCAPAITSRMIGTWVTLDVASQNVGMGHMVVLGFSPLVPTGQGALETPSFQVVNVDTSDPNLLVLGSDLPVFLGNYPLVFSTPPLPVVTSQMINLDPTHPDGYAISQPVQLNSY
jgi:hypothetical protein